MNRRTPVRAALLALSFVIAAVLFVPAVASAGHFANPGTTSDCNPAPSTDCTLNVQLRPGDTYTAGQVITVTLDVGYTFDGAPAIGANGCAVAPTVTLISPTLAHITFGSASPACTFGLVERLNYTGTPTALPCQTFDTLGNSPPYRICAVADTLAPPAPSITSNPVSPNPATATNIRGTAEPFSTVRLYASGDCSGAVVDTSTAAAYNSPGFPISVSANTSATYSVTATDAAGNVSFCSSYTYTSDTIAPAAPSIASNPASPSADTTPNIRGTADPGSTVTLYTSADCSGFLTASSTAAAYNSPGFPVSVAADTSATFSTTATDAAGNISACSSPFTYENDSSAPNEPTLGAITPASPANTRTLVIDGTAEAGSTVRLFATADCSGPELVSGASATYASPGLSFTLPSDGTRTYHATSTDAAGNVSPCSTTSITHTVDSVAPAAPVISGSSPASPADAAKPEIKGTAEAGSTVRVYLTADCSGAIAASGGEGDFAGEGITVTVPADTTSQLSATAVDAAGNVSPCSNALAYTEDSTTPAAPTLTGFEPTSPSNSNAPRVKGTAEAGSTIRLYTTSLCLGAPEAAGSAAAFSSPGLLVSVASDQTTTFYATTTDAAGHTSACSSGLGYEEDSTGPAAPTFDGTTPVSPSSDNTPRLKGTADAGTTVRLYASADCSGAPIATGTPAEFADPGLTVTVASDSVTQISSSSTDAAGNATCSTATVTYVEDSSAPAAPEVAGFDPASPANANAPKIKGSGEAGGTVRIYASADCTGAVAETGTVAAFAAAGLALTVADDTTTQFSATVTDAVGNVSPCSAASTYVEDSTAPVAPTLSSMSPASPANDNRPKIKGTAEAGTTVRIYASPLCAGAATASGSAAALAAPGLEALVANDSQTTFTAIAIDAAGNTSPCSASIGYTERTTPAAVAPRPDRIAPTSTIARITRTQKRTRRITLRGTADGTGSAVRVVGISVAREVGTKCRFLTTKGTFTKARSCARTTYLLATGTTSWKLVLSTLPKGRYKVRSRAIDTPRNVERKDATRNLLRFTL